MPAIRGFSNVRNGGVDREELAIAAIERGSRDPFGGRYHIKPLIDEEILSGFADPDEIENEKRLGTPFTGAYLRADDVQDGTVLGVIGQSDVDFRNSLDAKVCDECDCSIGEVCIKCCTNQDLMDISEPLLQLIKKVDLRSVIRGNRQVEMFDIVTQRSVAEEIGWLSAG